MEILVDKRTELIGIVLALSQGNEYIEEHFSFDIKDQYREKAYEHFSKFKNHTCIKLAKQIAKGDEGFAFDNPIRLAFSLNENLQFDGIIEDYVLNELNDKKLTHTFMQKLVKFAKDSGFINFFNENKNYYLSKIEEIKNLFQTEKFINELTIFLKNKIQSDFQINIIPMLINVNHGFSVDNTTIANIGLLSEDLKTIEPFNNGYNHVIIHEFCHSFVNCYTGNKKLPLPEDFKQRLNDYANPISYLNDTLVRAITIRLRERIENIDVQKFLNIESRFGFIFVKDVYYELVKYENANTTWEEYLPELVSLIINYSQNQKII